MSSNSFCAENGSGEQSRAIMALLLYISSLTFFCFKFFCREVMSHPVTVLRTVEKVGNIVDILKRETHNGFPVVQDYTPDSETVSSPATSTLYHTVTHFVDKVEDF